METPAQSPLNRRRFLTYAAIGGATIVGASALGGLDPDAAFAAPMKPTDPAISAADFAEGIITAIKGSTLHIHGSYGTDYRVQLTNATSVWKLRPTTAAAIKVGDGMYGRGVRMPDGTIAADAVWVNIVNLTCTIRAIASDRVQLQHNGHALTGRIVPGTTVAAYRMGTPTSDLSRLRVGQPVQVLGAWRPADGSVDVARFMTVH
ncbi:MAG TPA: twin-arginine translocation signal domain-containing protein [Streptosporangiaceae bacterium]